MSIQRLKIIKIVGARPNFMKIAPILKIVKAFNRKSQTEGNREHNIDILLVHTGQHYDYKMSQIFFEDLEIPEPDIYLGVGSGTHGEQTGKVIIEFEKILFAEKPDLVIVVGDVNSTLACALAAAKIDIPVAHVEAGLRSFDRTMPEEINRIVADHLSTYLFTPSPDADENLTREGIQTNRIYRVGNVMADSLLANKEKALRSRILKTLGITEDHNQELNASGNRPYGLLTLHRPSNVDDYDSFMKIVKGLQVVSEELPIIFPIHPRTKKQIEAFGLQNIFQFVNTSQKTGNSGLYCTAPMGYLDFMRLMMSATFVMTDSGGIQEETTLLGIPCLTLRNTTERPITISDGTNTIVGNDTDRIIEEAYKILKGNSKKGVIPDLWDGKAAQRIVNLLIDSFL